MDAFSTHNSASTLEMAQTVSSTFRFDDHTSTYNSPATDQTRRSVEKRLCCAPRWQSSSVFCSSRPFRLKKVHRDLSYGLSPYTGCSLPKSTMAFLWSYTGRSLQKKCNGFPVVLYSLPKSVFFLWSYLGFSLPKKTLLLSCGPM